jgi:hypothetical protein
LGLLKLQAAADHLQSQLPALPALPSVPALPSSAEVVAQLRAAQGVVAAYASHGLATAAPLGEQRLLRALLALVLGCALVYFVVLRGARRKGWSLRFSLTSRGGTRTDDATPTTAVVRPLFPEPTRHKWHGGWVGRCGWGLGCACWTADLSW